MWTVRPGSGFHAGSRGQALKHRTAVISAQPRRCVVATGVAKQPIAAVPCEGTTYSALWDKFSDKVQGEWEGVTVTFDASGVAQLLPERFVPGAYRDWGVELYDWQSQSSCVINAASHNERSLRNIFKRLMPTVGCEADAIAYVEEAADVWQADGGSLVKPVTASGGYLAAPSQLPTGDGRTKLEVCLAAPGGRSRLRAALTLVQHWESKEWQVASVDLSRESYDGPFNGGVELSGCAGGGKPFAKDPAVTLPLLAGDWRATDVQSYSRSELTGSMELRASDDRTRVSSIPGAGTILLPLGVWVGCTVSQSDVLVEVGALRGEAERDVALCRFKGGHLEEVVLASEVK